VNLETINLPKYAISLHSGQIDTEQDYTFPDSFAIVPNSLRRVSFIAGKLALQIEELDKQLRRMYTSFMTVRSYEDSIYPCRGR
jgi:hypothetical protein